MAGATSWGPDPAGTGNETSSRSSRGGAGARVVELVAWGRLSEVVATGDAVVAGGAVDVVMPGSSVAEVQAMVEATITVSSERLTGAA